jgi:transcriptional regulator with XRE-family HTH domain
MILAQIYVIFLMTLRKLVGKNIRLHRKEVGLTQEKLAWSADLTSDYVGSLERGEVNVSIDALERLAKVLKIDAKVLFEK